jgi:3-deoxy-D-manno-octulosonate 8-phosphate phosphatase (KDO 8-P phosphatase)
MIDPALAKKIRLVGFDVDGVLTDGGIYLGDVAGEAHEFKRYDIQDGIGMVLVQSMGLKVVIVTGRVSKSVAMRAGELGVDDFSQDPNALKLPPFLKMLAKFGIAPEEAAFLGDDFPDVPILRIVGLPVAVGNAVPEVKQMARHTLRRVGGHGAVREFCEEFLKARGEWEAAHGKYVSVRSGDAVKQPAAR